MVQLHVLPNLSELWRACGRCLTWVSWSGCMCCALGLCVAKSASTIGWQMLHTFNFGHGGQSLRTNAHLGSSLSRKGLGANLRILLEMLVVKT